VDAKTRRKTRKGEKPHALLKGFIVVFVLFFFCFIMSGWVPWMEHQKQCQIFRDKVFEQYCKQSREKDDLEKRLKENQKEQQQAQQQRQQQHEATTWRAKE